MRIPSLTRLPRHSKFNYAPRFYDPVKEDIERRTNMIRDQIRHNKAGNYRSNLANAFSQRARESKQSNIIQLAVIILLLGTFFGYIYFGNTIFYIFLALIPVYIYSRAKRSYRRK